MIKGYGVGRKTKNDIKDLDKIKTFDINTNFTYYGLPHPEFWVQDFGAPMLRTNRPLFDAIVCDPPYGVRARTQTVGVSDKKQARYTERKAKAMDKAEGEEPEVKGQDAANKEEDKVDEADVQDKMQSLAEQEIVELALRNYELVNKIPKGSATIE